MQPVTASGNVGPAWLNSPWLLDVIGIGSRLALAVWLVLALPVLYAGIGQLSARRLGRRVAAWAGMWLTGVALTFLIIGWQDNLPQKWTCSADGCGVAPYYGPAVVNMRELAICIAFLVLGAAVTWTLAGSNAVTRPPRSAAT